MLVLKNGLLSGKYIAIIVSFLCTSNKLLIATEQRQPLVEIFFTYPIIAHNRIHFPLAIMNVVFFC